MSVVPAFRPRAALRWQSFEAWVGTRSSGAALFVLALAVFALQSVILPVYPGRDMGRYVQTFVQYAYDDAVLPSVLNSRGPLAALGVGLPLELGGVAAEVWLAVLYAASIVAWGAVALVFGARAAVLTTGLLLVYPGYGILFHGLASDALFAAAFAGWALVLSRAILRPSIGTFLMAGLGMGALVLVRPPNQVLIVCALLPLFLRAPWRRRLEWVAAFFVGSAALTQGWKAVMTLRYGDVVALKPTGTVLVVAFVLLPVLLPVAWRRRLLVLAVTLVVGLFAVVVVKGTKLQNPSQYVRSVVQSPPSNVFLFRVFEMDRIVAPDNGPASRELARVVRRDLLTKEPYRSYGIDLDEFFSSGSDRMFVDLNSLGGRADLQAVTEEAIRAHPQTFVTGIAGTIWEQLWARRVYAVVAASGGEESAGSDEPPFIVVKGRKLPRPSEGQPIPTSHVGPGVFGDEQSYARLEHDTNRLIERIPTRDAHQGLVHRLNQASRASPPLVFWLTVGLVALAVRRPRRALVALVPSVAALVVIVATSLVTLAVAEYAVPVSPAFIMLAAAGLVGAHPRGRLRPPWRAQP